MGHVKPRRFTLLDAMTLVVAVAAGLAIPRSFGNFMSIRRHVSVSYYPGEHADGYPGELVLHTLTAATSDYMSRARAASFRPPIKGEIIYWARQLSFWPGPCMAALSLVTLGLGFGHARRPARRPAMVMALAVALAMATAAVRLPSLLIIKPGAVSPHEIHWREWWLEFWFTVPQLAGFAVAVSWAMLAFGGRWRPGAGWLDRLGVWLGTAWIGMALMNLGATWYQALPF